MIVHINDILDLKNLKLYVHCLLEQVSAIDPSYTEDSIKKLYRGSRSLERWVEEQQGKDDDVVVPVPSKGRVRKQVKIQKRYQTW